MGEDIELAGVVGDDHRVLEQAPFLKRADHRGFGDGAPMAVGHSQAGQMGFPDSLVGKAVPLMADHSGNDRLGHAVLDHPGLGCGVDHVVPRPARSNSRKFSRLLFGRVAK